jgi:hypothetical protein
MRLRAPVALDGPSTFVRPAAAATGRTLLHFGFDSPADR